MNAAARRLRWTPAGCIATTGRAGCALGELETSESTITKMSQTRALDGMQSVNDENFEYTWTYHPDDGLDVIITTVSA